MNIYINERMHAWLQRHPKWQQWLWFVALWLLGLASVTALTYPLKLLIKTGSSVTAPLKR